MINQGRSVPLTFRLVAMGLVIALIVWIIQNLPEMIAILSAIAFSMLIPMLWFSFQILTINPESKEIHYGTWVMGYKSGKPKKYTSLEKIFINKVKTSQNMYSQTNKGLTVRGVEFHAYLKYDEGEKIFLDSDQDEKRLEDKMIKIREKLGLS